jgi:hypothetical protein
MFAEDDPLDFGDADEDVVDLGIEGSDEPVVDLGFDAAEAPAAAASTEDAAPAESAEPAAEAQAVPSDAAPQADASSSSNDGVRIAGAAQAAVSAADSAPAAAAATASPPAPELPAGWERVEARSGGVYFFHAASDTATWTFPTGTPKHSSPAAAAEPAAASSAPAAPAEAPEEKKGLSIFGAAARSGRQAGSSQEPQTREADVAMKQEGRTAGSSSNSRQHSDAARDAPVRGRSDETAAAAAPASKSGPNSPSDTRKRRWGERFEQDRQSEHPRPCSLLRRRHRRRAIVRRRSAQGARDCSGSLLHCEPLALERVALAG